jgi:hypothetical protein
MLSTEPNRRDRAPQFSKTKPTIVLVNNRFNFILKSIDTEVPKGDEVCEFVEKRIGLCSRRNFETGCIRYKINDFIYNPYTVDSQYSEGKTKDSYTNGGVLIKDAGAASLLKAEVPSAEKLLKLTVQGFEQGVICPDEPVSMLLCRAMSQVLMWQP